MSAAEHDHGRVYLRSYLRELDELLSRPTVTDIYVNRPGEVWVETLDGAIERHEIPRLDAVLLERLARQIAAVSHQAVNRHHPLLSATLPDGARVQVIVPPATRGDVAIAIRKHVVSELSLCDYESAGAFEATTTQGGSVSRARDHVRALLDRGAVAEALRATVRGRLNILVSGGTSTGKTTFLNALVHEIPREERLIFIEDTPELRLTHPNAIGLVAARSSLAEASASADDLVTASLRMRPDRIILGELRGTEAFAFLRAINTGHPGSMTTVHADSPEGAIEQIVLLVAQGGSRLRREDVAAYVRASISVFVQLGRVAGRRRIEQVVLAAPPEVGGSSPPE
jgi:type IV secretion system protein VirB11